MRRISTILLALITVLAVCSAQDAGAGWFKKSKKAKRVVQVQRPDHLPTMSFFKGTVSADQSGSWMLDGKELTFAPDCTVGSPETPIGANLENGREVLVMGAQVGSTIIARRVLMQPVNLPTYNKAANNPSVIWSKSDPTVGEGSPPES